MFRRDYLVRQFEEFGKVMAVILGFKKNNEIENFELEIDRAVKAFGGVEINEVIDLGNNAFEEKIKESTHFKPEQIKILADLLYEKSFVYETAQNNEKLVSTLKKSYFLYQWYASNFTANEFNIEVNYRMSLIKKIITPPSQQ